MEEWKKIRKAFCILEIAGIILMIICLGAGVYYDWDVLVNSNIFTLMDDIESFSLTILQIQATVGTLIVAIIALITGNISDSYMGVSVSNFYLHIKPWILKQKVLIFVSLGLCLGGVICHSKKWYNMVFFLFIATLLAIIVSIIEIYSAFKGKNRQKQEIAAYINYVLESNLSFEKKTNIYQSFVLDWIDEVESQDKQTYENYLETFERFMMALWNYGIDNGLIVIKQQCYSMSYCLLGSEKVTIKERGIEFIQDVYDTIWGMIHKCVVENKPLLNQYKSEFPLFTEIFNELTQSIDELNVVNVEKRIRFDNLADSVLRVAIWFKYDEEEQCKESGNSKYRRYRYDFSSEVNELILFAKYIGYYLGKQQDRNNIINQRIWADVLNRWSCFSVYNIPEERTEDFLKAKINTYFSYCYGMLVNGQENVVKQGLYLKGMNNIIKLDNKYQALLYIAVHCYIYYLSERENADCVTERVKQSAKNIWDDRNVKVSFERFLDMLSENPEWLEVDMLEQIYGILDRYELFPKYESVKSMIMEYVVTDFYLFLILFMNHQYFIPELLEKNIDDMNAFRYVSNENEHKTKKMLKELFGMIFTGNKSEKQIDVEVGLMYDSLEKEVKKKQKERYIKSAKEAQERYKNTINEEEICEKIKNDTIKSIKEKFAPILVESDEKNGIIKITLFQIMDYTEAIGTKNSIDGYYSNINGAFIHYISNFLYRRKVVDIKNRFNDFANDKEFMKYLELNELHLLLGSQYIMKNKDYKISAEYKKFLQDYETMYTAFVQYGVGLKMNSIQVCLHDVNVSIHSPSIKETDAEYDKETGKYNYSILNGLPIDFEECELREFLYNNRKVINITAKVSIQVNEKPCGTIFDSRHGR